MSLPFGWPKLEVVASSKSELLVFAEYFEGLLKASDELAHVREQLVLVLETIAQLRRKVVHELVCFFGCLFLEILEECAGHVCALG